MNQTETGATADWRRPSQLAIPQVLRLVLAVLGAGFAWFAYIDAPITDGAMRLIAAAALAGLLCMVAALICAEAQTERAWRRWRRMALWSFALATALMVTAATVTLNLKGTGADQDTQTGMIRPA